MNEKIYYDNLDECIEHIKDERLAFVLAEVNALDNAYKFIDITHRLNWLEENGISELNNLRTSDGRRYELLLFSHGRKILVFDDFVALEE